MILTHGANSLVRGSGEYVEIGGRRYPTVTIGNQVWLAENLDYKFDGCAIGPSGAPSTPAAWYFNNDEATYGVDGTYKCGLLYNWYAAKYLDDNKLTLLPAGWRVPVSADFRALVTNIGGSREGTKIRSNDIPWATSWQGTNDTGFSALPCGAAVRGDGDNAFYGLGQYNRLWTPTDRYGDNRQMAVITDNDVSYESLSSATQGVSIRLVSFDCGKVTIGGRDYKTVKIGNQEWLAENLVLETSIFYYPNNNPANKENYGLLYPYKIVYDEIAPILPTGWRLPHKSDFDSLKSMYSTPADWISPLNGGNGSLGLNLPFAGYRDYSSSYSSFNVCASVWTDTFRETVGGVDRMYSLLVDSSTIDTSDYSSGSASQLVYSSCSVRLVKDAP